AGYVYATLDKSQLPVLLPYQVSQCQARLAAAFTGAQTLIADPQTAPEQAWYEARNLMTRALHRELDTVRSLVEFAGGAAAADSEEAGALGSQAATYTHWLDAAARARGAAGNSPAPPWAADAAVKRIPVRIGEFGPLIYQNDNVLLARLGKDRYSKIK